MPSLSPFNAFRVGIAVVLVLLVVCAAGACVWRSSSQETYTSGGHRSLCHLDKDGQGVTCKAYERKYKHYTQAQRHNTHFVQPPACAQDRTIQTTHHTKCSQSGMGKKTCKAFAKHKANAIRNKQHACNVGHTAKASALTHTQLANKAIGTSNANVSSYNAVTGSVSKPLQTQVNALKKEYSTLAQQVKTLQKAG